MHAQAHIVTFPLLWNNLIWEIREESETVRSFK